jgi:hypothetical protein
MKKIETLFQSGNYDKKHKLNVANIKISLDILNDIEKNGITLEQIEKLNIPVFKYKTQITVHGIFPELSNNYIGGYKSLIQNKNQSIGVKWSAVDFLKKNYIYETINKFGGWIIRRNSTDYFIYKTSNFLTSKTEYQSELENAKNELSHINKKLFYGDCGVYLSGDIFGYYLVTYINIGGVREENKIKVIENICNADINTINSKISEKENKIKLDREKANDEYKLKLENDKNLKEPLLNIARQTLIESGYELKNAEITNNLTIIKVGADVEKNLPVYTIFKYKKEPRQKLFRYTRTESNDLNEALNYSGYSYETTSKLTKTTGYVLMETTKETTKETKTTIEIIKYSEKSIAVIGDTKPIKDKLKELGGRFNAKLTCGAGWIFPIKKENELKNLI